jgi:hypothetical protein
VHNLERVTIGIKSFLRLNKLKKALQGAMYNLPECKVIVADDGYGSFCVELFELFDDTNINLIALDFDKGFGYKSNVIAQAVQTPYLLIGSDDFDFAPISVRKGIIELVRVLDMNPDIHIASGRVDNCKYEFDLYEEDGMIQEIPRYDLGVYAVTPWFIECDLTVNYSLIRREVFHRVQWDDDVRIGGGEHGAFFLDCKRAGFKTVYVPGVNVNTQRERDSEEYRQYRNRALSPERPCFVKRGIKKYVLGDGTIDYDSRNF